MLEKKEYQGYFYIPKLPDKRISGILYFYPNEKIRLELIGGCLSGTANGISCELNKLDTIFGVVKTENGTSKITLFNCYGSASNGYNNSQNCKLCISYYSCSYLLIGKHIENREDKVFNKIRASFPYFNDWYRDNQIEFDCENDYTAIYKTTRTFKTTKKFQITKDVTLAINGYSYPYDIDLHTKCLSEHSYIELENTYKSKLSDLLVDIGWFKDFYSFSSMTTMPFSEIYLYDYDDCNTKDKENTTYPISLFYVSEDKFQEKDKFLPHFFLFDYKKIEANFETIMQKWYEKKEDCEPIIQQLIYSVTHRRFYKSSDFLFVIQALEGYCNRFEKESNLRDLLTDLYAKFNDIEIVAKNKPDFNKVIDSRHHYSHILPIGKKINVCKGIELYELAEKLKPLLISCILSLIGLDNNKIDKLLQDFYNWNGNYFIER
jgi:hypothetical protein